MPIPEHAKKVFEGVIFEIYQWEQELFDGSKATFEKARRRDAVVVIPILENGNILLIEDTQPHRQTILTFPAGRLERDEAPEEGAKRELLEETGLQADALFLFNATSPGGSIDWNIHYFVARGCKKIKDAKPEAGEKIVPKEVSYDALLDEYVHHERFHTHNIALYTYLIRAHYDKNKRKELKHALYEEARIPLFA